MSSAIVDDDGMKLVEESAGIGRLAWRDEIFPDVRYEVRRFQAMTSSGLPVPGLHRIEGSVDPSAVPRLAEIVDDHIVLHLEDGRALRVVLADEKGRVLAEGHGPSRCTCC